MICSLADFIALLIYIIILIVAYQIRFYSLTGVCRKQRDKHHPCAWYNHTHLVASGNTLVTIL